jgi:hypothetical protein
MISAASLMSGEGKLSVLWENPDKAGKIKARKKNANRQMLAHRSGEKRFLEISWIMEHR